MIDTFDSRALRYTDCYGQRFMRAGTYPYNVLPFSGDSVTRERPFTIQVTQQDSDAKMKQHTVILKLAAGKFTSEHKELTIAVGDVVLWNCPDAKIFPYVVVGDKEFFASNRLVNESGFSHAFGSAGEYRWMDAYGSGASGVVRVKDPGCRDQADFRRWHKLLTQGTLVLITGATAEPQEVDIVTGQTVYFAITKGPGISITDVRLLARDRTTYGEISSRPELGVSQPEP